MAPTSEGLIYQGLRLGGEIVLLPWETRRIETITQLPFKALLKPLNALTEIKNMSDICHDYHHHPS